MKENYQNAKWNLGQNIDVDFKTTAGCEINLAEYQWICQETEGIYVPMNDKETATYHESAENLEGSIVSLGNVERS